MPVPTRRITFAVGSVQIMTASQRRMSRMATVAPANTGLVPTVAAPAVARSNHSTGITHTQPIRGPQIIDRGAAYGRRY